MAAFSLKVKRDSAAVKESTGGGFIGQSGIYPITINFVSIDQKDSGSASFNMNIDYNGNSQTIYGPTIMNRNGDENEIGFRVLNKLMIIAGIEGEPEVELETHAVGKDNKEQEFQVITELSGLECQMQTKQEYTKYKGVIKPKMNPENFFTAKGATADELLEIEKGNEDIEIGAQLAKILEKEGTTKYKLGKDENNVPVTDEEVQAFIAEKKSGKSGGGSAATPAAAKPKKNLFAK